MYVQPGHVVTSWPDPAGKEVAAVTVVGPKQRFNPARIEFLIPHVMEAARDISAQMGYAAPAG